MCGDAHLSNFGVFAAPDRRLVFDLNDFDETLPGPWEWDVKRLAASFEIAARDNGFKRKERTAVVETVARTYREAIREFAKLRNLEIWYARLDAEQVLQSLQAERPKSVKKVEKAAAKARAKDSLRAPGPAHPQGRRRAPDHQQAAADRAHRGDRGRRRLRLRDGDPQGPGANTRTP